ncbi:hypothetical protein U2F10_24300 [Leptothoe sp. EHU-05/26/07-4]
MREFSNASEVNTTLGNHTIFTSNVTELTKKLGIPFEQVQLPPSGDS